MGTAAIVGAMISAIFLLLSGKKKSAKHAPAANHGDSNPSSGDEGIAAEATAENPSSGK